jgi:hypothetical protein
MGDLLRRGLAVLCAGQGLFLVSVSEAAEHGTPSHLNGLISQHARANGLPEDLVHKVVRAESTYNPRAYHRGNYGLMQIRYGTARALGYMGPPSGLLDANTNLTYGVRYLAGAYRVAGGVASRAVAFYKRGYYYAARKLRRGRQPDVLTAEAAPPAPGPVQAAALPSPVLSLFALPVPKPEPSLPPIAQPAGQAATPLAAPATQAGDAAKTGGATQAAAPADEASARKDKRRRQAGSGAKQITDAAQPAQPAARSAAAQLVRPVSQFAGRTVAPAAARPARESPAAPAKRDSSEQAKLAKKAGPASRADDAAPAVNAKGPRQSKEADATAAVEELRR